MLSSGLSELRLVANDIVIITPQSTSHDSSERGRWETCGGRENPRVPKSLYETVVCVFDIMCSQFLKIIINSIGTLKYSSSLCLQDEHTYDIISALP